MTVAVTAAGTVRTSVDPRARRLWRGGRGPVLFGLVLVVLGLLTALAAAPNRGSLDPRAADRFGSRAVAELLRAEGVDVELVQTRADASERATGGSTLLVAKPDLLGQSQLDALTRTTADAGADVVLIAPGKDALAAFAPELDSAGEGRATAREPRCGLPAAVAAGAAEVGDRLYLARPQTGATAGAAEITACYPVDEASALIQLRSGGRTVTVLGGTDPLTNVRLAEQGNAALAMRLLGAHPRLVWYLPSLTDVPPEDQRSFVDLVPDGWWWGAAQLVAGVLLIAVWRARRLGPRGGRAAAGGGPGHRDGRGPGPAVPAGRRQGPGGGRAAGGSTAAAGPDARAAEGRGAGRGGRGARGPDRPVRARAG